MAKNPKFCPSLLSFSALVQGDPFRIYGKALRFLKLVFQTADDEDLVILVCTTFDWSTRVMDGQNCDDLDALKAVAAFARKNYHSSQPAYNTD